MKKIIKTNIKSVSSVDKENTINIELVNSHRNIIHTNVVEKLNARTVFEEERFNCDKYRLLFTIKPMCTNVLFNPFTEIVRYDNEGNVSIYIDNEKIDEANERVKLIQNTAKSKDELIYNPGYDIFNNHLIRSQTFKIVQNKNNKSDSTYNTLKDYMYDVKGKKIKFFARMWRNSTFSTDEIEKHLYNYEDILPFNDGSAINECLIEENGWFGFENSCKIKTRINGVNQNIDKVINSKNGGDFIDMYPDRTLFSFNPKRNGYLRRLEYNWYYVLTYPFACDKRHPFCKCCIEEESNTFTGLKLVSLTKTKKYHGGETLVFRTYTKHGLRVGDNICLTINLDENTDIYNVVATNIFVSSLGDSKGEDTEHYFVCDNMNLLKEIYFFITRNGTGKAEEEENLELVENNQLFNNNGEYLDDVITKNLSEYRFMVNRMSGDVPSEYYFRIFKKIPNFKFKKQSLTPEISTDLVKYTNYIKNNSTIDVEKGSKNVEFAFENSKLGFANSIYSDNLTQLVYTDDIDLTNIIDNLGRPVSEIYLTIIKNNKGYEKWYNVNNWEDKGSKGHQYNKKDIKEIEYSHCFGPVTCGLEFGKSSSTDTVEQCKYASNGDVHLINNIIVNDNSKTKLFQAQNICDEITKDGFTMKVNTTMSGQNYIIDSEDNDDDIKVDNLYYGDFVEYNPNEAIEKVLEVCNYRFNTYLREFSTNFYKYIVGWDIQKDDYDVSDTDDISKPIENHFNIECTDYNSENNKYDIGGVKLKPCQKPEGYYYKPHYRIAIKELGTLKQDSHYDMDVREAKPVQFNGIYISITTKLKHGCVIGDRIFICDDENNVWYATYVSYVLNKLTFYVNKNLTPYNNISDEVPTNWLTITENINNKVYKVRLENRDIPRYAQRINYNRFLWREILKNGDNNTTELSEYPYTNNAFYITQDINFYLKRQDPFGEKGIFTGDIEESFPQDIKGESQELDNYEYKDETQIQC